MYFHYAHYVVVPGTRYAESRDSQREPVFLFILRCDAGVITVCMRKAEQESLVWIRFSGRRSTFFFIGKYGHTKFTLSHWKGIETFVANGCN